MAAAEWRDKNPTVADLKLKPGLIYRLAADTDYETRTYRAGALFTKDMIKEIRDEVFALTSLVSFNARAREGQAVVCPLLRGSSPTRSVAPKPLRAALTSSITLTRARAPDSGLPVATG